MAKIKIALLGGGISGEREVSLKTAEKIYQALDQNKYEIYRYDPKEELRQFINDALDNKFDLVFPALHGTFGEDGRLQGMLDILDVPYVFSNCLASALAMNKYQTKIVARAAGVPVAADLLLRDPAERGTAEIIAALGLPIVVKPVESGSSVGMSIAQDEKAFRIGLETAFTYSREVLLEKYIRGRELTVAIFGNNPPRALPVVEIIPKTSTWFDFKAKYEPGASEEVCPANIPDEIRKGLEDYALNVFRAVGCKDLARADFIWDEKAGEVYFLEINTIPGMTATSLAPQAARQAGMEFSDFLDKLISMNISNTKNENRL